MKVDPDGAGFDGRRLERITEHFDEPLRGHREDPRVPDRRGPGRDRLAYWRSIGLMDRERSKPVDDDTIWRIYSMTKPITSIALMQLYERGCFS